MEKSLFLIFNHQLTGAQETDARSTLGVRRIVGLPPDLKKLWEQIPADLPELGGHLKPLKDWLGSETAEGDHVLIQGDFGACFIMVNAAFERGMVPVYATTTREAVEERDPDGSVTVTRRFRHQIFRKYGS